VSDRQTWFYPMCVRIKRLPQERYLEGFDLSRYEIGKIYEVGARLAELLVILGYADPRARRADRDIAADRPNRRRRRR
jgi:hypothetical protein